MQKGRLSQRAHYVRLFVSGLLLLFCFASLTACENFAQGSSTRPITGKPPIQLTGISSSSSFDIPSVQQLSIDGPFIATIHISQKRANEVIVRGDSALVDKVGYRMQNNNQTVSLVLNPQFAYPKNDVMWLDIYVSRLTYLQLSQNAMASVGVLSNYYFQAITKDFSQLTLFGVSRRMDLTAMDYSQINARQVKCRTGFIKTNQFSQISVITNGGLSAWALDQSNIYYYVDPVMVAPQQVLSGSVLRMSGIGET